MKRRMFSLRLFIGKVIGCSKSIDADNRKSHTQITYKQLMHTHTHAYNICCRTANSSQGFIMVAKRQTAGTLFCGLVCIYLHTENYCSFFRITFTTIVLIIKTKSTISRAFLYMNRVRVQKEMITNNKSAPLYLLDRLSSRKHI